MTDKQDDFDEVEASSLSPLGARPFYYPKHRLEPLREPDSSDKVPTKPSSGPEIDDLIPTEPGVNTEEVGIDDGLLPPNVNGNRGPFVPSVPQPGFGSDPSFSGGYPPSVHGIPQGFIPKLDEPDINIYQHKKTVAQGMMDIALLSANANQLRYVLESGSTHPYYYASLGLIGTSLILQVVVGVGLILNSRYNVSFKSKFKEANRINNYTILAIFLITVMNVFISAFGIATVNTAVATFPSSALREETTELASP